MRVGLIDVDEHNFPNLPLMKISAWHKQRGDSVVWYEPLLHGCPNTPLDKVYMSKVFAFTADYPYFVNAVEVQRGGSGYCIEIIDGVEVYHAEGDVQLPQEVEHTYPDYTIYPELTKDTAYGFLSRGCPRGCNFCHVAAKEGMMSHKVADLSEFWHEQKYIKLLDPNLLACMEAKELLHQLIDSKSYVDFTQGLDMRLMTEDTARLLKAIKTKNIHFAWDKYEDKEYIVPKFEMFQKITGCGYQQLTVYVLCNFNTSFEQDLDRIYTLKNLGYSPYVMLYDKEHIPKNHRLRHLQRWVNSRVIFRSKSCERFEDYLNG